MLSNIRKYTGLMLVVLILLFVGLVFFGDSASKRGYGQGRVVVEVDGRGYTEQEQQRLALSPIRLLSDLSDMRSRGYRAYLTIAPYLSELASSPDGNGLDPKRFLVNRLLLQKGMREFGVYPSDADIEELLRDTVFAKPDGTYDQQAREKYIERDLPRLGMSEKNMFDLLREVLALQPIQDIVSAGLNPSPDSVREAVEDRQQQIDYQLVTFPASSYEGEQNPSDEDVKTFWEENKGAYLSEAKRKINYILAKPDFDALLAEKKAAAEAADKKKAPDAATPDAADPANPDATANAADPANPDATADAADPAKPEVTLTEDEREAAVTAVGGDLDIFWDKIQAKEGEGFSALAKEEGFEVKATELFTSDEAPAEFKVTMRDAPGKRCVDIIFERDMGISKLDAVSDVRRVDKDQWLLFQIDEAITPEALTFEQAKDEAKLDLVKKLAREDMEKAAEEMHGKLAAAIKEGKSFKDAAAELELTPVVRTAVTASTSLPGEPTPAELFNHAGKVNPGSLSEILTQNDDRRGVHRSLMVFVDKRELIDSEANRNMVDQRVNSMGAQYRQVAMMNWLAQEYATANVREPAPK